MIGFVALQIGYRRAVETAIRKNRKWKSIKNEERFDQKKVKL